MGGLGGKAPHRKKVEGKCRKTRSVLSAFFLTGVERDAFNLFHFERSASAEPAAISFQVALTQDAIREGLARAGMAARGPPKRKRAPMGQLSLPFPKMRRA